MSMALNEYPNDNFGIVELNFDEVDCVGGAGELAEVVASGLAGAAATTTVAAIAGASTAGTAGAVIVLGGFIGGVALYYLTD